MASCGKSTGKTATFTYFAISVYDSRGSLGVFNLGFMAAARHVLGRRSKLSAPFSAGLFTTTEPRAAPLTSGQTLLGVTTGGVSVLLRLLGAGAVAASLDFVAFFRATSALSNALRDLPNRVLNVSVEERLSLFQNVCAVLDNPGVNSAIIRGICKVIGTTLTKYKDPPSQLLVRKLICDLLTFHHDLTIEHMLSVIKTLLLKELPLTAAHKSCRSAVVALGWICLLLKNTDRGSNIFKTEKLRMLEYQSMLYQTTLLAQNARVTEAATKIIYDLWENKNIFDETMIALFEMDATSNVTIMIMMMIRFETERKQLNILKTYKIKAVEYFVKSMILCKSKPEKPFITACQPLLSTLNDSEFNSYIYNDLQKSILRSPENTLESVGLIFDLVNIDCSPYASQIGTVLIKKLYSDGELARRESLESLKNLSQKCSDGNIIKKLLELIFSILNGSDGKINVVEYRINLLQGAGYLSFNNVTADNSDDILNRAVDLFWKALDTESQEKVICCTLEMFGLWCGKFKNELPTVIINIFKIGIEQKNTTQIIRQSYLEWLLSSIQNAKVKDTSNIVPTLYALYSKALQHFPQPSYVSEAACIACILLILDEPSESYSYFWSSIFDMNQKDLTPYLPSIIPGLKSSLLDPVPEVRAVSARALGAMVKGMGESSFEDLLPWLMQTLTSESSSVDRSGAAQGLSEVVGGLGVEKMHKLMPEIISTAERTDIAPHVKDGYIMMFIYMPGAFPEEFTPYIGQIINPILKALADESEYVRDTALKAGQRIVNLYAETAVALLLPELEKGLFDENWRIRYSSVQLLGDLLYRISGVSGKMTTETASEDDNFGTEQSHTAIIRFLGDERRNRVLSGLYMGRSDVSLMVRQSALHVWKIVVTNTPRTLREILPTLFGLLLGCLASTSYDKRQVAARTLGDLVRKLGERVLPEIIPILESGLNSEQADQRQGVCIGLSEIMASTSKEMVLTFVHSLVPTVRKALADPLPEVRVAAAKTFDSLHSTVGSRALDDILPFMLEGLSDPDPLVAENTLDGLRQVMYIKSRVVLPYLVPQLTAQPVNTKALSILVSVAGDALTKYLPKILSALLETLSQSHGSVNELQELEYCQTVILSVTDEVGIRTIMDTLMVSAKSDNSCTRKSSASLLSAFCIHSPGDYSQYIPQLLRCLLRLMADTDKGIIQNAWEALNAVIKSLSPTDQIGYVTDLRQAVRFAASDLNEAELPGFCLPKGITPLLPVFREAILNGLPEEKENAAQGLGEVIFLTSASSLQPSVVHITGPLIRILGDRFNSGVKAAVLETLAILLHKVGAILKQFLPQLQTTFLKALHDQNRNVRMKAGKALSELVAIHSRADPLFVEIHNGIKSSDDSAVRETMLHALRSIISPSGDKMSEPIKKQIFATLLGLVGHQEDITRSAVGGCLGAMLKYMPPAQVSDLLNNSILTDNAAEDSFTKHGYTIILFVALKECPREILTANLVDRVIGHILVNIVSDKVPIACNAVRAATYLLEYKLVNNEDPPNSLIVALARAMNHNSNDVKQLVAKSCIHLSKSLSAEQIHLDVLKTLVPTLVNGTKEKNGYVKSNSELALISILRLRTDETTFKKTCEVLETGAKDSLSDVVTKVLKRVATQVAVKEDNLDDTLQV
ncbi:GH19589 [Drosophila grimshawi]|uniref:GH19589 n=1 Tax=Drosophila grimshawi TaxID=7222 RepID=B4JHS8_DROGR|nr:GH19589 [Drosophila grimshawi]